MERNVITAEEAQFFLDNGYLIIRNVIDKDELRHLQEAADELTATGIAGTGDKDFLYGTGHKSGTKVFRRVDYVVDKRREMQVLLGHPFILRSVEGLMGRDLIPTWDSMVLKLPGEGIVVPWHRDAGPEQVGDKPIFNVDFYLDPADESTCVWVMPGSQKWSNEQAEQVTRRPSYATDGAVPAIMQPGDVMFHDILVVHGSPPNSSENLRRVIYYEFRTAHVEERIGPHTAAYIPLKQRVLSECIGLRTKSEYVSPHEVPFRYEPPPPYDKFGASNGEELSTFRFPHDEFWRN